jgi:hypothetical protein
MQASGHRFLTLTVYRFGCYPTSTHSGRSGWLQFLAESLLSADVPAWRYTGRKRRDAIRSGTFRIDSSKIPIRGWNGSERHPHRCSSLWVMLVALPNCV